MNVNTSSSSDSEDDVEVQNLLSQSKTRLEHSEALRIRSHLLRPEDYVRENNLKELFSRKRVRGPRKRKDCLDFGMNDIDIMTSSISCESTVTITDDGGIIEKIMNDDDIKHEIIDEEEVTVDACHVKFSFILFCFIVCIITFKIFNMMHFPKSSE